MQTGGFLYSHSYSLISTRNDQSRDVFPEVLCVVLFSRYRKT